MYLVSSNGIAEMTFQTLFQLDKQTISPAQNACYWLSKCYVRPRWSTQTNCIIQLDATLVWKINPSLLNHNVKKIGLDKKWHAFHNIGDADFSITS